MQQHFVIWLFWALEALCGPAVCALKHTITVSHVTHVQLLNFCPPA